MKRYGLAADTIRLSFFSCLIRCVGMVYNVWLTGFVGTEILGLSQLVSIVYGFGVTLACSGLRLASTQMCTRAMAIKKDSHAVLWFSVLWGLFIGFIISCTIYFAAPYLAQNLLNEIGLSLALRCSAAAIPFIAMTSAIYGYYTACEKILTLSVLQASEQFFQMALVFFCLTVVKPQGAFYITASLTATTVAAEVFSFGLACVFLPKRKSYAIKYPLRLREFFKIVLPSNLSAVTGSFLRSMQEIAIPASLVIWGLSQSEAVSLYGAVSGVVYPIIFLPSTVLSSLAIVIVPQLTRAHTIGNKKRITYLAKKLLVLVSAYAFLFCILIRTFGTQIAEFIFNKGEFGGLITLFAPLIPLSYLDLIVDSVLRSLDKQLWATMCSVIDAGLSFILVKILIPRFGISGLAYAVLTAKFINLSLSFYRMAADIFTKKNTPLHN